jgi:hypothetical protein
MLSSRWCGSGCPASTRATLSAAVCQSARGCPESQGSQTRRQARVTMAW